VLHERFVALDGEFKRLVTSHQLSGAPEVGVDVLGALASVHGELAGVLDPAVELAPRLAPYRARFAGALEAVEAGDARYLAHPLVDSYHTVWFELHEELIHLAGLQRSAVETGPEA
jgi:hypothetical protein